MAAKAKSKKTKQAKPVPSAHRKHIKFLQNPKTNPMIQNFLDATAQSEAKNTEEKIIEGIKAIHKQIEEAIENSEQKQLPIETQDQIEALVHWMLSAYALPFDAIWMDPWEEKPALLYRTAEARMLAALLEEAKERADSLPSSSKTIAQSIFDIFPQLGEELDITFISNDERQYDLSTKNYPMEDIQILLTDLLHQAMKTRGQNILQIITSTPVTPDDKYKGVVFHAEGKRVSQVNPDILAQNSQFNPDQIEYPVFEQFTYLEGQNK